MDRVAWQAVAYGSSGIAQCVLSVTKMESVLEGADANGGAICATIFFAFELINCDPFQDTAAACVADVYAVLTMTMDGQTQSKCKISATKTFTTILGKCGTASTTARAKGKAVLPLV